MKISWWEWLPFLPWRVIGAVESADDIPDKLPPKAIVTVGSSGPVKWVSFDCPCRSGHRIMLNTDTARSPAWSIAKSPRGKPSISPSINYFDGRRRCHYFLRHGRIEWSGDTTK
jgi:hypothetical protein